MFKNLIVCGDSFNTLSRITKFKGTHWSEHLSKILDVNLINLASAGCSNRMIAMQIEEAMKYDDSLIIFSPAASSTRIELLTDSSQFLNTDISYHNFVKKPFDGPQPNTFIISTNITNLRPDLSIPFPVRKMFLENIPIGFFSLIDKWTLYYTLDTLKKKQKKFLFVETVVHTEYQVLTYSELVDLVGEEHIISKDVFRYQFYVNSSVDKTFEDPVYHTRPEDQITTANIMLNIINERIIDK